MSLTSNRILDILILSAIFALAVMVFPVHAAIDCSITTGPVGYKGVVYQPSYPAGIVPLYDSLPGIAYNAPITITCNGSTGLVDEYYTPDNDPPTYIGGRVLCTGCSQASTNVPWSGRYRYRIGMNGNNQPIFWYAIGGASGAPTAAFSGTPTSGAVPLAVQFTSTSTGLGSLSYLWDFGDGDNTNSTAQNPLHIYSSSGTYTVNLTVSSIYGTDSEVKSSYIAVSALPVAAFSCTPTNTTSPVDITCTDSSSGIPTGWLWQLTSYGVSISPGGSYGGGIFSAVNSTQNPVFHMTGSGKVDVRLTASNSVGSGQEYKPEYITISGEVPTPTPTPGVPWPNQTGVCIGSGITLGSGQTRAHDERFQLTDPYGDTYSGIYATGVQNYIVNQPFFTALKGQYVYQERSAVDQTLEWQQSYITDYCVTPTSTATTTNIPVTAMPTVVNPYVTGGPTYNPYPVPTITLTNPNGTINIGSTWVNLTTIPTSLPPLPSGLNESHWREVTCSYGATGALLCPWLNVIYTIIGTASDIVFLLMSIGFLPLSFITTVYNFVSSLSVTILSSWLSVGSIIIAVIGQVVNVLPDKVKNVVTLIMCLEIFKQLFELWDWVD